MTAAEPQPQLVVLGGGGHAAVIAESAARAGWRVVGIAAAEGGELGDPDGAGAARVAELVARGAKLHAAVGAAEVRARWMQRFGEAAFATIVDPSAHVSPSATIGAGCAIGVGAVVHARAVLHAGTVKSMSTGMWSAASCSASASALERARLPGKYVLFPAFTAWS